ncbi:hypothetical protein VNO77_09020 [Canavalia gladiata]|uniref:Uncharacterized protein n=1 Tax=Canavalia gladiata TaxID=3824 RepID=A0AAN9MCN1_CANGL
MIFTMQSLFNKGQFPGIRKFPKSQPSLGFYLLGVVSVLCQDWPQNWFISILAKGEVLAETGFESTVDSGLAATCQNSCNSPSLLQLIMGMSSRSDDLRAVYQQAYYGYTDCGYKN